MKINPIAAGSGQPGQSNVNSPGRTADPIKLERARQIARGEKVEQQQEEAPIDNRPLDSRRIKMRTQRSVYRDGEEPLAPVEVAQEPEKPLSSTAESNEQATVEATQPLSPQFAALAKQKRALQVKERELQEREAKLAGSGATEGPDKLIERLKSQPLSVLQEHGVTYEQLTDAILNGKQVDPETQALKQELQELKKSLDQKFQTNEERQEEAALTEMLYEAEDLAKEGEDFALIREQDAYDRVLRLIHSHYKQTQRVLDVRTAMERVETELLTSAEKLARLGKVQSKIAPPAPPPLQPQQRQMRTLTARDSSSAPMTARQRAIAAFSGTLKR